MFSSYFMQHHVHMQSNDMYLPLHWSQKLYVCTAVRSASALTVKCKRSSEILKGTSKRFQ